MITPEQCKAARELLGWSYGQLAAAANVSVLTAVSFEYGHKPRKVTQVKIRTALEAAGVNFNPENGDAPRRQAEKGPGRIVTREQCRIARVLLGWDGVQMAAASGSNAMTLHTFEYGQSKPRLVTLQRFRLALEAAGVEFIDENGGGPGVRLRKATPETAP